MDCGIQDAEIKSFPFPVPGRAPVGEAVGLADTVLQAAGLIVGVRCPWAQFDVLQLGVEPVEITGYSSQHALCLLLNLAILFHEYEVRDLSQTGQ